MPTPIASPSPTVAPAPSAAGEIDTLDLDRALLPRDVVGSGWFRSATRSATADLTFVDPCGRQPLTTIGEARFQELRDSTQPSTTPWILQAIGRFEPFRAQAFIQDALDRCPSFEYQQWSLGDDSARLSLEDEGIPVDSVQEYVVLVRRQDWIMMLILDSYPGRVKFDPAEVARISEIADERFERLLAGEPN